MSTELNAPATRVTTPSGDWYPDAIDLAAVKAAHIPLYTQRTEITSDGNQAAAVAGLQMWRCLIYAGFPITPSTKWAEFSAATINGQKGTKKRVKLMEAEHAVADYMAAASAACRDLIFTTATSSVGLDHMYETIKSMGASGLGNAMLINVYRCSANYPLCIEGDPSDTLGQRDSGWIQISCRGKQQIYDTVLQMPCVGMHHDVLTPTMPGFYGIKDSHRNARLICEPDSAIHEFQDRWIKPCALPGLINGDTAMGNCVTSRYFQGFKVTQKRRFEKTLDVLPQVGADFERTFGRPGVSFFELAGWPESGGLDLAVVSMGPDFGTFEEIREGYAKKHGLKVGGMCIRLLSPFPREAVREKLRHARAVLVVNQAHHQTRGHLTLDVADALCNLSSPPAVISTFCGMGGADVSVSTWEAMLESGRRALSGDMPPPYQIFHEGAVL